MILQLGSGGGMVSQQAGGSSQLSSLANQLRVQHTCMSTRAAKQRHTPRSSAK